MSPAPVEVVPQPGEDEQFLRKSSQLLPDVSVHVPPLPQRTASGDAEIVSMFPVAGSRRARRPGGRGGCARASADRSRTPSRRRVRSQCCLQTLPSAAAHPTATAEREAATTMRTTTDDSESESVRFMIFEFLFVVVVNEGRDGDDGSYRKRRTMGVPRRGTSKSRHS